MSAGTGWARFVLVVGAVASVVFNYGATALDRAPWYAYPVATLWPVLLFGAIELIARTDWGAGRASLVGRALAGALIGGVAAWVSYWHGVEFLTALGYDRTSAHLGPIAVDAGLALGTAALARIARAARIAQGETDALAEIERLRAEHERAVQIGERERASALDEWFADVHAPHEPSASERAQTLADASAHPMVLDETRALVAPEPEASEHGPANDVLAADRENQRERVERERTEQALVAGREDHERARIFDALKTLGRLAPGPKVAELARVPWPASRHRIDRARRALTPKES